MPRKKVTFVKTGKEIKEGKFKGLKTVKKSKTMSEKRAKKKQAKGQGYISKSYGNNPVEMSPYKMGHSPAEMGHDSPAQNHHYGMRKGESVKQEKYNLMNDNPVARDASGGRSWMSKHSKSALNMGHSPLNNEGDDEGAARKEYDLRKGIVDPKTGKRSFPKADPNAPKKFVTKQGKALTVGAVGKMKYN